jgi:hypothetical protein
MIPWVTSTLHALHDVIFDATPDMDTGNPWIDHLRHSYHDADHLLGLMAPLLTLGFLVTAVPYYVIKSLIQTKEKISNSSSTTSRRKKSSQVIVSTIVLLGAVLLYQGESLHQRNSGLDDLITGVEPRLQLLLEKCPLLRRGPIPPVLFSNRHLQLIPWILQNLWHYGMEFERHKFSVTDCVDKRVANCVPDPNMKDEITLDVFPPFNDTAYLSRDAPVVLIAPGLFDNTAYEATMAATSLQEVLNASTSFAGYPDADSFYAHVNPVNDMQYVTTPLYTLNSVDDPCCHAQNLYEKSPLPQHEGRSYADIIGTSARGIVAVAKTGSHCPFLDGKWIPFVNDPVTGGIMLNSWADQSIAEFYAAALQVYGDRRFL